MADPPMTVWLHIGPNSAATVTINFPGTHKAISLTANQAFRLREGLIAGCRIIDRDDGEHRVRNSINLLESVEA